MQLVYSSTPPDWATGYSLGKSYPSAEMHWVYSAAPAHWARIKFEKQCVKCFGPKDEFLLGYERTQDY